MLLTSTETDRHTQKGRCDIPEAQPGRGPKQEEWESVLFQRDMKGSQATCTFCCSCEESITAGAQLKDTHHHRNTYTHPGMHIK